MDDRPIIDKELEINGKIKGSLGLRIFLISLVLLVLPLTIHSLFMYRQEYKERKKDLLTSLEILGESRALILMQQLHFQKDALYLLKDDGEAAMQPAYLQTLADKYGISELTYLSLIEGNLVCTTSSDRSKIGHSFPLFLSYLDTLSTTFLDQDKRIWVTLTDTLEGGQTSQGMWLAGNLAEPMISDLSNHSPYPLMLFLIDEKRQTAVSSGGELPSSFPTRIQNNTFEPLDSFAVRMDLPESELSLILTVPKKSISDLQFHNYLYRILSLFFLIFILGGLGTYLLVRRISQPLRNLIRVMDKVYRKNRTARYKKDKMGFEINVLGEHFNRMIDSLIAHQKQAEKERVQKELLERQFSIGREIQMSLFPSHVPEISGLDITPRYQPAHEVGGDFYDLFLTEPGKKLGIVVADTSGKGISACLYSLGIRSILRALLTRVSTLNEAMIEANRLFSLDTGESSFFVTAWIGLYDPRTHLLEYTSCGHHPGILVRKGQIQLLKTSGIALGVTPFTDVQTETIGLEKGDLMFLYTDGVVDTQNSSRKHFGAEKLEAFLERDYARPSASIAHELTSLLSEFSEGAIQYDDLTFLVFKVK